MLRSETGYAPVAGGRLYYEEVGDGYPLALNHAGVADHRMWDAQVAAFAPRYRVIRYDARGFGRSSDAEGPFSYHQDLRDLLAYLGVARAHVLGLSLGATTAINFALAYPEMVSALVVAAGGVRGTEPSPLLRETWEQVDALVAAGQVEEANELELRLWVDGPGNPPDRVDPGVRERMREWNLATLTRGEGQPPQPLDPPARDRLGEIGVPTLVIVGDQDVPDVQETSAFVAAQIPGARRVVIPGVAHMINLEKPAEFNRLVLEFLDGVG
jgi:pimeloyl-ACP methyl ester carboxylesterase